MILSEELIFSDDQAIASGTVVSTNIVDLGSAEALLGGPAAQEQDIGKGNPVPIYIGVTEDFAGGTSVQVQVQTDDNESFSDPTVVIETAAVPTATLVAGYVFAPIHLPRYISEQYLRLAYVVVGTHTAGTISAGIVGAVEQAVV